MEISESGYYCMTAKPSEGRVRSPLKLGARSAVGCISTRHDETCCEATVEFSCIFLGDDASDDSLLG